MKVIYIPVVIPMNTRTFLSMGLMLLGGIITVATVISNSWFVAEVDMTSGSIINTDDPERSTTHLALRQGLQVVNVIACSQHKRVGDFVTCTNLHVNYMQCTRGRDDVYNWCDGRSSYLAVFSLALVSGILGLFGWLTALYRENKLLYPAGLTTLLNLISAILYFTTYHSAVDGALYPSIRLFASLGDGAKFISSLGISYGFFWVATLAYFAAFALSFSARWSDRHASEPVIITSDFPVGSIETDINLHDSVVLMFDTNSSFIGERARFMDGSGCRSITTPNVASPLGTFGDPHATRTTTRLGPGPRQRMEDRRCASVNAEDLLEV